MKKLLRFITDPQTKQKIPIFESSTKLQQLPARNSIPSHSKSTKDTKDTKVTFRIDKENQFPQWYERILTITPIVDTRYPVKGMMVWQPYGYKALKLMLRLN